MQFHHVVLPHVKLECSCRIKPHLLCAWKEIYIALEYTSEPRNVFGKQDGICVI
jgi:hypothetical protein